ncbi:YqxA family protein [Neobacillus sp. CF12]|uniref:YqxA family protein n=1 Tax=Neobacillus sp. CF12 TaxID=3055864 RepID=UPI0025A13FD9|nr:YqxA family protein [Neobacillus sp. CF12]MDM5330952.1 YqxA family protein [Neobacillus sp. CF12]
MKMFMLKFFCILALMFISVLAGMQLANDGIHKMKGYDDPNFQNAVAINDNGEQVKATFLGNEISSHDLNEKKKKLEEISAFNLFSSMGKKISQGVSNASEKLINLITK